MTSMAQPNEYTIIAAFDLVERINARSFQSYELIIGGERNMAQSWALYVSNFDGRDEHRCKIAVGNWLHIARIINALAECHDIAYTRIYGA